MKHMASFLASQSCHRRSPLACLKNICPFMSMSKAQLLEFREGIREEVHNLPLLGYNIFVHPGLGHLHVACLASHRITKV